MEIQNNINNGVKLFLSSVIGCVLLEIFFITGIMYLNKYYGIKELGVYFFIIPAAIMLIRNFYLKITSKNIEKIVDLVVTRFCVASATSWSIILLINDIRGGL